MSFTYTCIVFWVVYFSCPLPVPLAQIQMSDPDSWIQLWGSVIRHSPKSSPFAHAQLETHSGHQLCRNQFCKQKIMKSNYKPTYLSLKRAACKKQGHQNIFINQSSEYYLHVGYQFHVVCENNQ